MLVNEVPASRELRASWLAENADGGSCRTHRQGRDTDGGMDGWIMGRQMIWPDEQGALWGGFTLQRKA